MIKTIFEKNKKDIDNNLEGCYNFYCLDRRIVIGFLAQLVEQSAVNRFVTGSSPVKAAINNGLLVKWLTHTVFIRGFTGSSPVQATII